MKTANLFGQFSRDLESRWQKLYRLAFAWSHDVHLAKDIVQDSMIKAMKKRHQLDNNKSMDAWLFSILANTWRDYCRKNTNTVDIETISCVKLFVFREVFKDIYNIIIWIKCRLK